MPIKVFGEKLKAISNEFEKLLYAEAAPSRIERQLKKLNGCESDCVLSLEEALANVEEEKLMNFIHKYCRFLELPQGFYPEKWCQHLVK